MTRSALVRGNSIFRHTEFALRDGQVKVVLRGLVPRIHVFVAGVKGVDGRVKPGQDEGRRRDPPLLPAQNFPRTALRERGNLATQDSSGRPLVKPGGRLWTLRFRDAFAGVTVTAWKH